MALQNALTELEAVNIMLSTIGEAPVSTLTTSSVGDVSVAHSILTETSREVQAKGWHFNSENKYPLAPDVNGAITLPVNIVSVDLPVCMDSKYDIVQRGTTLYDRLNRTSVFTETLYASVILLFDYEQLPEAARRYICVRAARKFQDRVVGSGTIHGFNARDEFEALAALKEAEGETADHNIFNNYDVARAIDR